MTTGSVRIAACVAALAVAAGAPAWAGFDRSAEVAQFLPVIQSAPPDVAAIAAKRIYSSGLSDPALASALNSRLLAEETGHPQFKRTKDFSVFMVEALASSGNVEYRDTLNKLAQHATDSATSATSKRQLLLLDWYKTKADVMQDDTGHASDEAPLTGGLVNLLRSEDYSFKHWAAERMYWDRLFDPSLIQAIAPQLQSFVDQHATIANELQDDTLALYVRMLGYSKNTQYSGLLQSIAAAPNSSAGMKKYAKKSLQILWKPQP